MTSKAGRFSLLPLVVVLLGFAPIARNCPAQTGSDPTPFSAKYNWGVFAEDSPTSSPMLLGNTRQREQVAVGAALTRRLLARRHFELDYLVEVRPLLLESDPTVVSLYSNQYGYVEFSPPLPVVDPGNLANFFNIGISPYAYGGYSNARFSRRWTYVGGADPFGFKLNGFQHRRIQPEAMVNAGLLVATRDIPIKQSSYFNFAFQFGGGVQWYRTASQSLLLEYRFQHFSSKNLGTYNPGTDAGIFKLTYWFGEN
jgi:hypothetical protein